MMPIAGPGAGRRARATRAAFFAVGCRGRGALAEIVVLVRHRQEYPRSDLKTAVVPTQSISRFFEAPVKSLYFNMLNDIEAYA